MALKNQKTKEWYLIDLKDQVLGRVSTKIANILNGKNDPSYLPNLDQGGYVVAINASKIVVTGNKALSKRYYKHSGYIGNLKTTEYKDVFAESPEKVLLHSVAGMLPKNKLRDLKMSRLKVYKDENHPHINVKFING